MSFRLPVLREEFPEGSDQMDEVGRRDFIKLLGATVALAGCERRGGERLLPYHQTPQTLVVGNPLHYATSLPLGGLATPLVVRSREGRPVKIEGNPEHPLVLGAAGPIEQSEVQRLYDPYRAQLVKHRGRPSSLRAFRDQLGPKVAQLAAKDGGAGVRFLCEPSSSVQLYDLKSRVRAKLPNARFVSWAPLGPQTRHDGARLAFGRPLEPLYDFSNARVIASFDSDFLAALGPGLGWSRAWADRREPGPAMSRLYVAEPSLTVTGTVADHRLRLKGSAVEGALRVVVAHLAQGRAGLGPLVTEPPADLPPAARAWLTAVADDLAAAGREALVVVGDRQPPVVHALAHAVNMALGAVGHTVRFSAVPLDEPLRGPAALEALSLELAQGRVDLLVATVPDPAYCAYANLSFGQLLERAPLVYLGTYEDETAERAEWFLPRLNPLEAWGDARALDGSIVFQQPLIEPLYAECSSEAQLFAAFAQEADLDQHALFRGVWLRRRQVDATDATALAAFSADFERWVQLGGVPGTAAATEAVQVDVEAIAGVPRSAPVEGVELALERDYKLYDGRFASCSWLLELPDPVTKLCWDNAALMSAATARKLGVEPGLTGVASFRRESSRVRLEVRLPDFNASVVAPVFVLPGHADDCITLHLGWGKRAKGERVAQGVGVSAYALRHSNAPYFAPVEAQRAEGTYELVTTQEHWRMEGRELALQAPVGALPHLGEELEHLKGPVPTVHQPRSYEPAPYKWGMAIDLNRCTGCSSCVTACQAENNIPVVGKQGVARNREMFWIRVDRYFVGDADEPSVITQPVTCQHCETAPCEYVCPVNATVHSNEGLNDMVYNRCIGTRYCSNNCPYKVRRFNYFAYHDEDSLTPVERLRMNPEVTVRARGVMEKCTFCVQRIERARIETRREGRQIRDGELMTACQQACPTAAIVFGSLHDPTTAVSRRHLSARRYDLLHDLGTRPRNAYLVRIKNPNPRLEEKAP